MKITLKKNNKPTKPGTYLMSICGIVYKATVVIETSGLWMEYGDDYGYVSECSDLMLWSDAIEIVEEK